MTTVRDRQCGRCGSQAASADVFCGDCGNRLPDEGGRRGGGPSPSGGRGPSGAPLPLPPDDLTTRHLCATAHLDDEFAEFVAGQLVDSPHRAIHPCPGVNLLAVARHAEAARTARRGCRFLLTLTRLTALIAFLVMVANSCSSDGPYGYYSEPSGPPAWTFFLLPSVTTAVLITIVFAFRWSAFSKALEIMDPGQTPEQLAAAVGRSVESRLTAVDSSNVIVFSGLFCGFNPFGGSGQQIASWGITMDITIPGRDDYDEPRRIERFDAADLHDWLAREVPDNTLPDIEARERLYVSGVSAPMVPHLVPQPRRAPSARIPDTVLTNVLRTPTSYARTYLCFEKTAWSGQFVFSYLVRAEILRNKTLFMEGVALAMPPLTGRFLRAAKIPAEPSDRVLPCLRDIAPEIPAALFGRPLVRLLNSISRMRRGLPPRPRPPALGTENDFVVDYGAIDSIRTLTAADEIPWYFFSVDEEMYLRVLERRVLENTVRFLRAKGVDTSEFEREQTRIVNKTHFGSVLTINGNVSGSGNVFGDSARVTQVGDQRSGGGQ